MLPLKVRHNYDETIPKTVQCNPYRHIALRVGKFTIQTIGKVTLKKTLGSKVNSGLYKLYLLANKLNYIAVITKHGSAMTINIFNGKHAVVM